MKSLQNKLNCIPKKEQEFISYELLEWKYFTEMEMSEHFKCFREMVINFL